MKLYIYVIETKEVIAIATGETNEECEDKAFNYLGCDECAATYTPEFGGMTGDGLVQTGKVLEL